MKIFFLLLLGSGVPMFGAEPKAPVFEPVEIDKKVEIGYGVTVADVDGDGKPDILLADKNQFVWYKNPTWQRYVLADHLTQLDDVCIAARDIDGDGKAEIAVGAGWNPSDTVSSGSLHYLIAPSDRTKPWEVKNLHHEPTIHRIRWVRNAAGKFDLVSVPLHGRGNKNAEGAGVKILRYKVPKNLHDEWETELIDDHLHQTHNLDPVDWDAGGGEEFLVASKEGVFLFKNSEGRWSSEQFSNSEAGEARQGRLSGGARFFTTVEPFHGTNVVAYTRANNSGAWNRQILDATFKGGHALACGDLTKSGRDQILAGWRDKNADGKVGIKIFIANDGAGKSWKTIVLDDNTMACEDLCLADLDGDGRLDVIAAGRASHNLKIYWNRTK